MTTQAALVIVLVLALLVYSYIVKREKTPDEAPAKNLMDPSGWQIGPIMQGQNMSVGMPLHPSPHPDGWSADIPYPNAEAGHAHYFSVPTDRLTGKVGVRFKGRFEKEAWVKLVPTKFPGSPWIATPFFQRRGDDSSGEGEYESYRWFASFASRIDMEAGDFEFDVRFTQNWTAIQTSSRENNPTAYQAALDNAGRIGFVLGGGDGLGHGVYATGPCRLVITEFNVE